MQVHIATDGRLDPSRAATAACRLAGDDGRITVLSVIEVPRELLEEMRAAAAGSAASPTGPEYQTEQVSDTQRTHWVGDDAFVDRYVANQVKLRTADLVAALDECGAEYEVAGIEGENAAKSVLEWVGDNPADFLLIGTHGLGRFEGMLGSTSTKLARLAPCSVVLVR
ncbi:universal stress protein [Ilumatobacter sp.]|uniref:universal stress protein n=1 Tax=Ilumatobacter sp. TaxID=1967498 RepID=UPI003AF428C9